MLRSWRLVAAAVLLLVLAALAWRIARRPPQPNGAVALFERREDAYRANNRGVALLEQFNYGPAADAFRSALERQPDLALAHLNLGLALFYLPDVEGAAREAKAAADALPSDPRPHYVLGLIARAQGRMDAAADAFKRVVALDANDVGSHVNLGQIYLEGRRYADAIAELRAALGQESFNITAAYNLGLALTRAGQLEEGLRELDRSQKLREGGYGVVFSTSYLEQGRYAEAVRSTGLERELVDATIPDVSFVRTPVTISAAAVTVPTLLSPLGRRFGAADLADGGRALVDALSSAVTLLDIDGDGDLDLFVLTAGHARLLRNDGGTFADVTTESGLGGVLGSVSSVAADYDNDGRPDLLILGNGGNRLFHNDGRGRFSDVTARAKLPPYPFLARAAAFVDFDHDGDLDIVVAGLADLGGARDRTARGDLALPGDFPAAPVQLIRNNGDGSFVDITRETRVNRRGHAVAIVATDFDDGRDVDLLVADADQPTALFKNLRDGTFSDVAGDVRLKLESPVSTVAVADFNKDDFPDFFFGGSGPGMLALSDGRGRFTMTAAPEGTAGATAAQAFDYDNDGLVDLLVWTAEGPRLFRQLGTSWKDVSARAFGADAATAKMPIAASAIAVADLDGDGDTDMAVVDPQGAVTIWRNDGGNRRPAIRVQLSGRASNRSGVGAKIEVRAGSLRQRVETSASTPAVAPADVLFGLGRRSGADALRVLWPSGILQAEIASDSSGSPGARLPSRVTVEELDRKPSSCPFLFTWNGSRFEFVTDFMGAGEMGYLEGAHGWNHPDPDEYVRIREDQLRPRNGRYELRVTNELEETLFVDRLQLLAVTHPKGIEVFPNGGMADPPKAFELFGVQNVRPLLNVHDEHGHDVTSRLSRVDGRYVDDFELESTRGYAASHVVTFPLGPPPHPSILLLTGWTDYAFSSDNFAAAQSGRRLDPPSLQARGADGTWKTIVPDIGIPVGRPQTVTIDLRGRLPRGAAAIRVVTNMRIYWDQAMLADISEPGSLRVERLDPLSAELKARGFSAEVHADPPQPTRYDYERATRWSPWKAMIGRYTRFGDVRTLVTSSDDRFVISAPGDELALSFDAARLGPVPEGSTRTFLLFADGFSKEMDVHSASPRHVEPLPFHGMPSYPYEPGERRESEEYRRYRQQFNTRRITSSVPPLDLLVGTEER